MLVMMAGDPINTPVGTTKNQDGSLRYNTEVFQRSLCSIPAGFGKRHPVAFECPSARDMDTDREAGTVVRACAGDLGIERQVPAQFLEIFLQESDGVIP